MASDLAGYREWLFSLVPCPKAGVWADFGCGTGADALFAAERLAATSCRVVGLDRSAKSIQAAIAAAGNDDQIRFVHHDLDSPLPFGTGSIDVAFSQDLIECLSDRAAFAQEIGRVVRPGGWVVMAHWDWDTQLYDGTDKALIRRLIHAFADWKQGWMDFADGWMGRRLWGTFHATGMFDGEIRARVLTNTVYEAPYYGYARAQDFRSLVEQDLATAEDYAAFLREQEALALAGRYFYAITGFAYVGQRRTT